MGINKKIVRNHEEAIKKLEEDVGAGNYKTYNVEDFDLSLVHPEVLAKCTKVVVACSASTSEGRDWLLAVPFRLDKKAPNTGIGKEYNLDPFMTAFDTDTETPAASGVYVYHGKFEGRNIEVKGYDQEDLTVAISEIRKEIETKGCLLEEAPEEIITAMDYMAKQYKKEINDKS